MDNLACGERIVRCLLGEPIDHVPYGIGLGWSAWRETHERWRRESGDPNLNVGATFGFDGSFASPSLIYGIHPPYEAKILEEDEEYFIQIDSRGIKARCRKHGETIPEYLGYPVNTPEDWENLKRERLQIDPDTRDAQDWDSFRSHIQRTGCAVQVGAFPWGIFGTPRDFLGVEELLISFYTEPEMVRDMMEHLTTLWISLYERTAKEVQIDHIHIWEDMSGRQGSLISPKMVEEFMMPCYDRITGFARTHGVRIVSVDTDGDCSELVPIMMDHGINMFFPFEVQAGNDILEYRKLYPELGIIGGLDKRALARSKSDIDVELDKAARMIEKGRYVPAFDHSIPPDVPWENYVYAAEKMRRICYGEV